MSLEVHRTLQNMICEMASGSLNAPEFLGICCKHHEEEEMPRLHSAAADGGGGRGAQKLLQKPEIVPLSFGLFLPESSLFCGHFGVLQVLVSCRIFFDRSCMKKLLAQQKKLVGFLGFLGFEMNPPPSNQ